MYSDKSDKELAELKIKSAQLDGQMYVIYSMLYIVYNIDIIIFLYFAATS